MWWNSEDVRETPVEVWETLDFTFPEYNKTIDDWSVVL